MGGRLEGRIAVITGGSRGIGAAIAKRLAADGATVVLGYRSSEEAALAVVSAIMGDGGRAEAVQVDVTDPGQVQAFVDDALAQHGKIDIAIANAGVIADGLLATLTDEDWSSVLDVNAGGAFRLARAVAKPMMMARSGVILTLSSVAGTKSGRGQANYAASKGAIEAMTRSLAVELGKRGVRVLALAPGIIETDMSADVRSLAPDEARSKVLLHRFGAPEEVANVAAFLVSDEASYMTGAVIPVDGGFKMA